MPHTVHIATPSMRDVLVTGIAAALVAALAAFGLSLAEGEAGFAPLWIANAAIAAALLRFTNLPRALTLAATGVGLIVANLAGGMSLMLAIALSGANVAEILVAVVLMNRVGRPDQIASPRYLFLFMLIAGVVAPIAGAVIGSAALSMLPETNVLHAGLHWFVADALGMLVVGPIILTACNPDCFDLMRQRGRVEMAGVLGIVALVATLVFEQARYPALFMILPLLTLAGFRLRFMGTTLSILIVAIIASWHTLTGSGPIAGSLAEAGERILFLQMFLAVAVVSSLPVAATLVEREALIARLRLRERQYRLLATHTNDMIVRLGLDGVRRYVSPASQTILGYSPEELVGQAPYDAIHPDDRDRVLETSRSLLDGQENPVCTYRQQRRDGSFVWLEASYRLVRDDQGAPAEFVASVREITQRRKAEETSSLALSQLQESLRLLSMAERIAGIGHWRYDALNRTLFWSDEVHRIHGRDLGDTPPLDTAMDAYHPEDRATVVSSVEEAIRDGTPWSFRARIIRTDGEIRQVETLGQPELAADGTTLGIFGVIRDITDEAAAEAALITARDEARALADTKSAFLATMSHEIRTPMTGVLGMIELLRADPPADEQARYLENLEQSATLLMTVLDDVLDFSKIESGALTLESIDFDLGELARTTLDLFHHAASSKGLSLNLSVPVGRNLRVRGDPVRLRQIIANLVSNAIKFTPSGRIEVKIDMTTAQQTRVVRCHVADTGVGIEADVMQQLFQPFVQADASTTRRFGGTGLGLAISRRLAEAMDGTITVESTPGKGTTFCVELQLAAPENVAVPTPVAVAKAARSLSILMAEDNAINQALVAALVRRDGHEITIAENGRLAVEVAAERRFDVILMDMQMPEMDGLTATGLIRNGGGPNAATPIFALTADAAPERRGNYQNAGLTALLTKPVDSAALAARLSEVAATPLPPAPAAPAEMRGQPDALPVLNRAKLDALEATVGPAHIMTFLSMMADEIAQRPPAIARLIELDSRIAAGAEAHALKGAALNIGADRIADVARQIETACETGGPIAALAGELMNVAAMTAEAIEQRRGNSKAA